MNKLTNYSKIAAGIIIFIFVILELEIFQVINSVAFAQCIAYFKIFTIGIWYVLLFQITKRKSPIRIPAYLGMGTAIFGIIHQTIYSLAFYPAIKSGDYSTISSLQVYMSGLSTIATILTIIALATLFRYMNKGSLVRIAIVTYITCLSLSLIVNFIPIYKFVGYDSYHTVNTIISSISVLLESGSLVFFYYSFTKILPKNN